jgi:hypothetical protein
MCSSPDRGAKLSRAAWKSRNAPTVQVEAFQ